MDDKIKWNDVKQGDANTLEALFNLHYKPLCYYILQFTKNMPEAEDIVQDLFIKVWTKKETIEIKTSLKAYLYRSAHNAYTDHFRKQKLREGFLDALKKEALSTQLEDDHSVMEEKSNKIKKLINTLPPRCKEILLLNKYEGFKHREIAEKLGISIKTVEKQLSTAFKKIRKGFKDDGVFLILIRSVLKQW